MTEKIDAAKAIYKRARRPLLGQIRRDVWGEAHASLWQETRDLWRALRAKRAAPKRRLTETFESLAARKRWTEAQIQDSLTGQLRVHWTMYAASIALLLYAAWIGFGGSPAAGLMTVLLAGAAAVQGYCAGYRAYQLKHRRLMSFGQALRDIETWLVL